MSARAADQIINSFEPSGTPYSVWTAPLTTCAVLPACGVGPCVTVYISTLASWDGAQSGQVWLQESPATKKDCTGTLCNSLHPVTIQSFAPKDWSSGFLKVAVSGQIQKSGAKADMGLWITDTLGGNVLVPSVSLTTTGKWYTAEATLGYLVSQGLRLDLIDKVSIIFPSVSVCTSVLVDALRLSVGTPPCTPNSVSAIPGDTQITLNWVYPMPCPGTYPVAQYCVYRATYAINLPLPPTIPASMNKACGVSNPLTDTGLANGTTYYYKVTAIDTDGNESAAGDAAEQDFATPTCGGSAPGASAVSWSGGIRIMWSPVPGASAIKIYRSLTAGTCASKGPLLTTQPGVSVYYDDTTVSLSQLYCYTVTAVVSGCEGPCSNQACETFIGGGAPPCSPPGPILSLSALARQTDTMLAWTEAAAGDAPISYYKVFRGLAPPIFAAKVFDTGDPIYSWTSSGLPVTTTFCWQVCAVAQNSCSSYSAVECATTGCDLVPPSVLSGVGWCDRVRLSWNTVAAAQYKIYRTVGAGACAAVLYDVMPGVSVYYDDMNVVDGTTYAYVVTASGASCDSVCSTEATALFRTTDPCPPVPPCTPPGMVSTPTGVTGTAHVAITWTRPTVGGSPLSRYFVWLGAGSTGTLAGKVITATVWDSDGGPTFTATATGLSVDTTYCAIIEVADDGSPSCTNFSAEGCFTTACVPPPPPGVLNLAARPPSSLLVSWASVAGGEVPISRYLVFRATAAGGAQSLSGTTWEEGGPNLSFTATGIALTQDCWYQVMAVDVQGCTSWTAGPPSGFHGCTPPGLIPVVSVNARAPASLLVSWAPPAPGEPGVGLSRYLVYRSTGAGLPQTLMGTVYDVGGLNLSTTVSGLNLTQEHCFQVMAIDQAGCTIWSDPPPATGCRVCTPPGPMAPFSLSGLPANNAVVLGWLRPPPGDTGVVSRYLIFRATAPGAPQAAYPAIYDNGISTCYTFTNTGASPSLNWCYQINAVDLGGCSGLSSEQCYTCDPPQWGLAHEGTSNVSAIQVNSTNILVTWDFARPGDTMNRAVTWNPVDRYLVYRSTGTNCYVQQICGTAYDDGMSLTFSVTVTGLGPAAAYSFEVMAVSRNGCATLSVDCSGAGTAGACSFLEQPVATALTGPTGTPAVGLQWKGSSTPMLDGYDILRGTDPTGGASGKALVASVGASAVSWTDTGVEPGRTYYYVLLLKTSGPPPCSVYSSEASATLPALRLAVYPNPAAHPSTEKVRFDGLSIGSTVEIYTVNGELVRKSPANAGMLWQWDGTNDNGTPVSPGIYLWIVRSQEGGVTRGKLVVGR